MMKMVTWIARMVKNKVQAMGNFHPWKKGEKRVCWMTIMGGFQRAGTGKNKKI